ncbi:hypothetical protein DPMN_096985 [Dreissena polymorpha]|uniref:Uncharacterized protein n=1 Tax=Dreissena polymorpha TaxID=45954 RepID=A0A9D4R503_DREPO|nr:hypothetical protein DPMN_096985 [Dreissena polymorpha]
MVRLGFKTRQSARVPRPSGHLQKTSRHSATVPESLNNRRGTCRRLPGSVRRCQFPRQVTHLQHTPRQSTMVPRPSGHLQENPRLCQTVSQTYGAPARDSLTVGDDTKTVLVPAGDFQTVPDGPQTVGAPAGDSQTVCDGGKSVWAPAVDSHTVPDNIPDRRGTSWRLPDGFRRCQDRQCTCRRHPDGARNSPKPSGNLQETLRQSATMPRLSWHQPETPIQSPRPVGHLWGL